MKNVIIIGCGAAGMMAAINLSRQGNKVTVLEKNDKPGKKLFITGKGRCNITNSCDEETFLKNVVTNPKFLYSAIYNFNCSATVDWFYSLGLKTKLERGNRVFPLSDHSSDVISSLVREMERQGVTVLYNSTVKKLYKKDEQFTVEYCQNNKKNELISDAVVVATGGKSYASTGSSGDGYAFAKELGLKVIEPRPALVPLEIKEEICKNLMGLSLKNISVKFETEVKNKNKKIYEDFGEMIFTHFGVSGPVILSASSRIGKYIGENEVYLTIDLKPAISMEQLDQRIIREFTANNNKQLRNAIADLLPKSMIMEIITYADLDPYKKVSEITREEREKLIGVIKNLKLTVKGTRGFDEAIITQGGISIKEINPQTMEVKNIPNLFYIGEVLDLDAVTGGYNLQIAWSTAMLLEL